MKDPSYANAQALSDSYPPGGQQSSSGVLWYGGRKKRFGQNEKTTINNCKKLAKGKEHYGLVKDPECPEIMKPTKTKRATGWLMGGRGRWTR